MHMTYGGRWGGGRLAGMATDTTGGSLRRVLKVVPPTRWAIAECTLGVGGGTRGGVGGTEA